jgi:YggT family protein
MDVALSALAQVSYWALTLYLWMILVAVLLTWVAPDPRNPIVAFLNRMTAPLWNALARVLPGRWRLFAAYAALLAVMFLIEFVPGVLATLSVLAGGRLGPADLFAPVGGFFLRGVAVVLYNVCYFFVMLLVIWFILTLVSPSLNNPLVRVVFFLVDPVITPLQRLLPRLRVDVSPLLAAGLFFLFNLFVVSELMAVSHALTALPDATGMPRMRL